MNRLFTWLRSPLGNGEFFWTSWSFVLPTVSVAVIVAVSVLVRYDYLETGFGGKTLWDWIEVLGVPVSVAVIAGGLGIAAQRAGRRAEAERELATERAREATLRAYLDRMSDLILNHQLRESTEDSPARAVAHARTLGALRSLNGPRKGILIRFLHESHLINKAQRVVSLDGADLTDSELSFANLEGANLGGAVLTGSDLRSAKLAGADFAGAGLRDVVFFEADLRAVNLRLSVVSDEQLMEAADLVGATMPDETQMTEERWEAFKAPRF